MLDRKQFIVDVYHQGQDVSKKEVTSAIAKKFKVSEDTIIVFGFRYRFGGGRSQAFALVYDSVDSMMKYEPKYRLIRKGVVEAPKIKKARKTKKEEKNRLKKVRGTAKVKGDKKKK